MFLPIYFVTTLFEWYIGGQILICFIYENGIYLLQMTKSEECVAQMETKRKQHRLLNTSSVYLSP